MKQLLLSLILYLIFSLNVYAVELQGKVIVNINIEQLKYLTRYDIEQMLLGNYRFWYDGSIIKLVVYKNINSSNARFIIYKLGIPLSYYKEQIEKSMKYDIGRFIFVNDEEEMLNVVDANLGTIGYINGNKFIIVDRYKNVTEVDIK